MQFVLGPALIGRSIGEVSVNYYFWRHLAAILVGVGALYLAYKIPLRQWFQWSAWIIMVGLGLSLLAFLLNSSDARWLQLGGFSLQPAEILKLGFIFLAAGYFHKAKNQQQSTFWQTLRANQAVLILLGVLGSVILVLQRDYGSMFVLSMVFVAMFYLSGIRPRILISGLVVMALVGSLFIAIEPYRRERLAVFFNPTADCQNVGYQICQALIGVGSGGVTGRGFSGSVQVYGYLPEANNDSIFAIYAELAGFLGTVFLLGMLVWLLSLIYRIASKLEDALMLVAIGILVWLGVQSLLNIAGILNLIPLKGITLPLISYGGSSLVAILFAIGLLLQMSAYTINKDERTNYQAGSRRRRNRGTRHSARHASRRS